ncbi:hypothetical protein V6N13_116868 [Hibiscus sabdariffa]
MVGNLVVEKGDNCVGLFLLWNDSVNVKLLSFSNSHIDVEVEGGEIPFRFTGMYGTSDRRRKHEDWELLDSLKNMSDLPCCYHLNFWMPKRWPQTLLAATRRSIGLLLEIIARNPVTRKAAVGVIARNSHGMMIDGSAFQLKGLHIAESAEACAFKE